MFCLCLVSLIIICTAKGKECNDHDPMKKIGVISIVLLLATLLLANTTHRITLVPLTIVNRTEETVYVWLRGGLKFYYFAVEPGQTKYTIERDIYRATLTSCGSTNSRTIEARTQTRITFPACKQAYIPRGEPSMIKKSERLIIEFPIFIR